MTFTRKELAKIREIFDSKSHYLFIQATLTIRVHDEDKIEVFIVQTSAPGYSGKKTKYKESIRAKSKVYGVSPAEINAAYDDAAGKAMKEIRNSVSWANGNRDGYVRYNDHREATEIYKP